MPEGETLTSGAEARSVQQHNGPTEVGPFPKPSWLILFPQLVNAYPDTERLSSFKRVLLF
jgi:hypothetical protein